ncbi:MAG: hypothetical protein OCD03_01710 [Hyphomicrobiales bacterium]
MRITKIQNLNFSHSDNFSGQYQPKENSNNAQNSATPIAIDKQLVPTQTTEYKRFTNRRLNSNNPFLAQYIDQSNTKRSRGFIGRKPAWQVQKSYKNSSEIAQKTVNSRLDMSI